MKSRLIILYNKGSLTNERMSGMFLMHDIWVNWAVGQTQGYNVWQSWEWRKSDKIARVEEIPLIKVERSFLQHVENSMEDLPEALLHDIKGQSIFREGGNRKLADYACVLCDGLEALAIYTGDETKPFYKSRIVPKSLLIATELVQHAPAKIYDYNSVVHTYGLQMPSPKIVRGLSRTEKTLKQLLLLSFDRLLERSKTTSSSQFLWQLRYWYGEFRPDESENIKSITDVEELLFLMQQSIEDGWSSSHEALCRKLIQGYAPFEELYEQETEGSSKLIR